MGSANARRRDEDDTTTMTRIFTISSGAATPRTECSAWAIQGWSDATGIDETAARAIPSSEMLPAPRKNAVQTLAGGPGRSPAAITSHRNSSAGATAAVPMTVGRDSSSSIWMAIMPFFRQFHGQITALRPQVADDRAWPGG